LIGLIVGAAIAVYGVFGFLMWRMAEKEREFVTSEGVKTRLIPESRVASDLLERRERYLDGIAKLENSRDHDAQEAQMEFLSKGINPQASGLADFVEALSRQPSIEIASRTHVRLERKFQAECGFDRALVRIRVTSGPETGRVGLVCKDQLTAT
jgi:hypothetical protein